MLLSIVIPMYNVQDYIENCLKSILRQTYKNYEIIIVDDGSTDQSYDKAFEILSTSNFKKWKIIEQNNQGVSIARNIGLSNATGDFIYFLDSDDFISKDLVEQITKKLNEDGLTDILVFNYSKYNNRNNVTKPINREFIEKNVVTGEEFSLLIFKKIYNISMSNVIFRLKNIKNNNIKFYENCINGEDREFIFKNLFHSSRVYVLNATLFYYNYRGDSISNTFKIRKFDSVEAYIRILNYYISLNLKSDEEILSYLLTTIMENYYGNLNSFIRSEYKSKFVTGNNVCDIFNRLEFEYPTLTYTIEQIIQTDKIKEAKIKLLSWLYIRSKWTYFNLVNLEWSIRKIIKKVL